MVMKKGEFMKQILMCLPEIFSGQKNLSKVIKCLWKRGNLWNRYLCVYKGWNMNEFETNELMSNWMNELKICWNKLKCNFFKNHSHLDSKTQKSSTRTTLYFYHVYVSTKVGIWMDLKLMNWCQTEWMNLKYVEINWNVIFSKIILILILKPKEQYPYNSIFLSLLFQYFALPLLSLATLMIKKEEVSFPSLNSS